MDDERLVELKDIFISILLAIILLLVINFESIFKLLFSDNTQAVSFINEQIATKTDSILLAINDLTATSVLVTGLVWGLIGNFVYVILHFLFNRTKLIADDISVSIRYVHPKNFSQLKFWVSSLWIFMYPLLITGVSLLWIYFSLKVLIPYSSTLLLIVLSKETVDSESILFSISSMGLLALMVLGAQVLIKLFRGYPVVLGK